MNPLAGMPSSTAGYPRGLLVWLCVQKPAEGAML